MGINPEYVIKIAAIVFAFLAVGGIAATIYINVIKKKSDEENK